MGKLQNLPTDRPRALAELVAVKPRRIVSRALSKSDAVQITVLAFSETEDVSEEEYFGDTFYYVIEGQIVITSETIHATLRAGDIFLVPAHTLHAVGGGCAAKILQVTVREDEAEFRR